MPALLTNLSGVTTIVIAAAAAIHVVLLLVLWTWARRDLKRIAGSLDDFTRGLKHRSVMDKTSHLSDQIEAFLADVREVLEHPGQDGDRELLAQRMNILDEKRRYLNSVAFESGYTVCRTMIEAYPLAGVLGTILAIGAALQTEAATDATQAVSSIVAHFGDAIWSTFAGLTAAILLMFLNSVVETPFLRLGENRANVRDTVARVKRELSFSNEDAAQ